MKRGTASPRGDDLLLSHRPPREPVQNNGCVGHRDMVHGAVFAVGGNRDDGGADEPMGGRDLHGQGLDGPIRRPGPIRDEQVPQCEYKAMANTGSIDKPVSQQWRSRLFT